MVSYVIRAQHPFLIVMLLILWSLSTDELQLLILELGAGGIYLLPQKIGIFHFNLCSEGMEWVGHPPAFSGSRGARVEEVSSRARART